MGKLESHFNASVLLRIGHKNSIKDCWDNNRLSFGCAANWIHYANKGNVTTGDSCECVFSRIPKGKAVDLFDRNGKRIEANLQRFLDDKDPNFEFLRYVPTMLTPALCFYSLSHATPDDGLFVWDETRNMPVSVPTDTPSIWDMLIKRWAYCRFVKHIGQRIHSEKAS